MSSALADLAEGVMRHTGRMMECHNLRCHNLDAFPPERVKIPLSQTGQITGDLNWPTVIPTCDIASADRDRRLHP